MNISLTILSEIFIQLNWLLFLRVMQEKKSDCFFLNTCVYYVTFDLWHEQSRPSVSVVCDVVASYTEGLNFRQYFAASIRDLAVYVRYTMHELEK